ncbi:hypothetical protein EVAR_55097_1 [Eumeta japonica]|uniref:Uncharacterized protein n=1 Tax=Eumeta variegata TaxID=151549 RepID=A0A4C1YK95_EUMVA|nr:hypothetical protein EVAR_55097_1 [Eumeta japonica]
MKVESRLLPTIASNSEAAFTKGTARSQVYAWRAESKCSRSQRVDIHIGHIGICVKGCARISAYFSDGDRGGGGRYEIIEGSPGGGLWSLRGSQSCTAKPVLDLDIVHNLDFEDQVILI